MVNNPYFAYGVALICVINIAIGQVMFKTVSARIWPIQAFIHDYKGMAILFTAMTIYALSAIGWVFVLRMLPLGKAYMFMSCSFLLMPLIAHLVFGEPLTIKTIFGSMLIVIGILVSVAL